LPEYLEENLKSVRDIEALTGLDFFPNLSKSQQADSEKSEEARVCD
jgi:hypothetical protein